MSARILIVDGQTNQALACVRSLGRAGYTTLIASTRRWPLAAWSRYTSATFRLRDETIESFSELRAWAVRQGVTLVLPLTERSCTLCNADRSAWEHAGIILGCAPADTLRKAFDKRFTLQTAIACGVRTPATRSPHSVAQAHEDAAALGFPCVVKPRFSHAWDGTRFMPHRGPAYLATPDDVTAAVLAARQGNDFPLIQGYVPGRGKGVFALCDTGRPIAWFAHQRLRETRPSGSGSALRQSIALDARLREPAEVLLRALEWHGPAMVEFRDDGDSAPCLMEVNGRFWTSLELAVRAGADFPRWWIDLLLGGSPPLDPGYRVGVSVRWLLGDVKYLAHVAAGRPGGYPERYPTVFEAIRKVLGPQPRDTSAETWLRNDPWPALGEWIQAVEELAVRVGPHRARTNGKLLPSLDAAKPGTSLAAPLRVLMITSDWPTPDAPRTTHFVKRQADFLRAAGVELDVFQFSGRQKLWNYIGAWFRARRILRAKRYDLIHAQFGQSGVHALPKRVPLVVTYRGSDLLGIVSDTDGRYTWRGRINQWISRLVASRADAVIVVSEHMKAALPPGVEASVVPSGLDLDLFRPIPRDEARRRLGLQPEARYVLFVGRAHQARKRCALARQAVEIVNRSLPTELLVAWGIPHADMPLYVNAADVVICTSTQEGSPNSVKEALACNVPVVSVDVGDVAERLRGVEGCELCADDQPETIAAALERVMRRGSPVNGRAAVAALDENVLTQQVIGIYRSAVNGAHAVPAPSVVVREASAAELAGWDAIVERFPGCRVVHTRAWMRSLEDSGKGQPLYLVFEKGAEIVGCLPGLLTSVGPFRLFGSPLPGWQSVSMGPVFDPAQVSTRELLATLLPYLERHWGVHHVELMCANLNHDEMRQAGFRGEPVYTYRAPLSPGDEARTLKAMKDSARRNIRRGLKLGLVPVFEDDESFLDEHMAHVQEVFTRGGHSVPMNRNRVVQYFRHMRNAGRLLAIAVYLPDRTTRIASGLFTIHGKELLLWTWAHREQYRWYRGTELLTWTVMQRAMAAGCETVDFMGRGDFKAKFGAELDGTKYRWVRSRYAWLTHLRDASQRVYRLQQAIRGRLARVAWRRTDAEPASV